MKTKTRSSARLALLISVAFILILGSAVRDSRSTAATCMTSVVVLNNADSGAGSLRQAILDACDGGTITFANSVGSPILLTSAELKIDKNLTIQGPGANLLAISGGGAMRVFNIGSVSPAINVTLSGLAITGGQAPVVVSVATGGGILNASIGALAISSSTISGNTANGGAVTGQGGGICNIGTGTLTMTGSTISGNSANSDGGGIFNLGTLQITNSTIAANTATTGGGGIAVEGTASASITNCTIAGNSAGNGGGIFWTGLSGSTVTVDASIVAKNTVPGAGPDLNNPAGTFTDDGHNLIGVAGAGSGNTGFTAGTTQTGTVATPLDPKLEISAGKPPLKDNGGPTFTIALLAGSLAIDNGDDTVLGPPLSLTTDQRGPGFARKVGAHVDVGAFEFGAGSCVTNPIVTTSADSDAGSLRQAILDACDGSTITFASSVTSPITLATRELLIDKNLTIQGPGANLLAISGNNAVRVIEIGPSPGINVTLSGLTITNGNFAGSGDATGGGLLNNSSGTLTLNGCGFLGNTATGGTGGAGLGGGLFNSNGTLTIDNTTFASNTALGGPGGNGQGGALFNMGTVTVANSTIFGNNATGGTGGPGLGGGIDDESTGSVSITSCTIAGNNATGGTGGSGDGGGIFWSGLGGSTVTVDSTIVASNTAATGPDLNNPAGTFTDNGHNLIGVAGAGSGNTGFTAATTQTGTVATPLDPKLGPLQNNGGPTSTLALLTGSPAIDKGDDAVLGPPLSLTTDQRGPGFPRKLCAHVDVGAFEFGGPPTVTCPGNISVANDPGRSTALVSFAATASDFCDGALTPTFVIGTAVITSPHTFPAGTTTVTSMATDSSGLTGKCSFTVTVALSQLCIQDDTTGDTFVFNIQTGAYTYTRCRDHFTLAGTGFARTINNVASLTDFRSDRRISASLNLGQQTGRVNITVLVAPGVSQTTTIVQNNPHPTCACP